MPEPLVVAERFGYRYPEASRPSLRDVSLSIEPGTFTVLAGVSGSGKSTLLRAFSGLVPHFHGGEATGELHVGGLDVREHGPGELAAVCGTVFQEPETQVVMGGVRAELELPLEHRGEPAGSVARAVEETALALAAAGSPRISSGSSSSARTVADTTCASGSCETIPTRPPSSAGPWSATSRSHTRSEPATSPPW